MITLGKILPKVDIILLVMTGANASSSLHLATAVTWLEYCRYGIKPYTINKLMQPRRWRSGLERWPGKRNVLCSNPSRKKPKSRPFFLDRNHDFNLFSY